MATAQHSDSNHIPELYYTVPLKALQAGTRHRLSLHLNILNEISFNDWRHLAEMVGLDVLEIQNIQQSSTNPTDAILMRATQKNYTVGQILKILLDVDRYDIFEDCGKLIEANVNAYKPIQVAEVSSESRAPLTFGELNTGKEEYFDAFVSYHIDDYEFVKELLDRLEVERGFKLCIPDRDFCIGLVENEATAVLIKKRCKRVIIVLSTSYIGMDDLPAKLKWQLQVAQTLAPVADKMHKLVPIVIDSVIRIPQDVPEILLPYNVCDYTRPAIREWFWERMEQSLAAKTSHNSGYRGPSARLGTMPSSNNTTGSNRSRMRTNTAPTNIPVEDTESNSDSGSAISSTRYHRSESDTTHLPSVRRRDGSNSQFYRPMPTPTDSQSDSPKTKKKWWPRK